MLNIIIIQGRLVADPETRYTKESKPVANFKVAVERDGKAANGKREADFIRCVAFGEEAAFVEKWFKKGTPISVTGRLQLRTCEDQSGAKKETAEILASKVGFVNFGGGTESRKEPKPEAFAPIDDDDSMLPF